MRKKIIAAGGLIENEKHELLLIYRRGKWDLPKGKMETGETPLDCALREVHEETGLKTQPGSFIGLTYHDYFDAWNNEPVTKETHWFAMKVKHPYVVQVQTEEDIENFQWVLKEDLATYTANTYPNIISIISKWKELGYGN